MSEPFDGVRWWRLRSVPRPPRDTDPGRWLARSIAPVLSAAHPDLAAHPGGGLYVAWLRPPGSDQFTFLVGARPDAAVLDPGDGAEAPVLFPPGATASPVDPAVADRAFALLPAWVRCLGAISPRPEPRPEAGRSDGPGQQGFDEYATYLRSPFGWVVVARPLAPELADEEAAQLAVDLTLLRKRESSEAARLAVDRGQARYRELEAGRRTGLWQVHVLAGGADEAGARRAAALLCGAADLEDLSWSLIPSPAVAGLGAAWGKEMDGPDGARSPFVAGTGTAARLARGPARELPGVRLTALPEFDVTPETAPGTGGVVLGDVLDAALRPAGAFAVPHDTLNRHGFVCGATGSGKSQTARRLLESLARAEPAVPWLVVEPAKAEYARMSGRLRGVTDVLVIRPGDPGAVPASLNPLEPEPGFPLQSHADLVRSLFLAAFEADEPFPQVLSRALTECYTDAGWDLVTGRPRGGRAAHYPALGELQATARRVVDDIGYGREVAADVRGFVDVRMGSLRQGTPGRFFEGGHPLDVGALLRRHAVLELEGITSDQDKAFLMGAVLIRIVEHLRVRRQTDDAPGLRHVLLIEEAHRLLKNIEDGPAAAAVELFASLLAEIRAYGEGVVVVEQIPSKILPDVIKNTALKVMHRLPAEDDRKAVGATINLPEAGHEAVVAFRPGLAAVAVDGWDRPLLARMAPGDDRESADGCDLVPPLAGRRSALCGASCRDRACVLSEMSAAAEVAGAPLLTVWAETVAAAIVMGVEPPRPRANVLAAWPADERLRECALATLVGNAVAARRRPLARWVDPADFGRRLHETLRALLAGEQPPERDPRQWRAGAYRWVHVQVALAAAIEQVGGETEARGYLPHPATEQWQAEGLFLDAGDLAAQMEQLLRDPAYGHGSDRVALGDVRGSGLRAAVIELAGHPGPQWFAQAVRLTCTGVTTDLLVDNLGELLVEESE